MGRIIVEQLLKILWLFPIKNNRIVFRSSQGSTYNCNPKYICEFLQREYPDKFELVWIFNDPSSYVYLEKTGIKVFRQKSLKGLLYIITAKFLIDNHGIQSYIPVRRKQIVINTWHGGGSYKKSYINATKKHKKYVAKMNRETTAFLSSCKRFSTCNLRKIYEEHPEKILATGMPRNDIFFKDCPEIVNRVKQILQTSEEKKIVLYAPTFRDETVENVFQIDVKRVLEALNERFDCEFVFAVRFHQFTDKKEFPDMIENCVVDVTHYDDMQELIYASDVVISDYSSCIWDTSLAWKPCFIFATDLEQYMDKRNFYTPIEEWPFPIAKNMSELIKNILDFDAIAYANAIMEHHKNLGSYETGEACKKVADYILSFEDEGESYGTS